MTQDLDALVRQRLRSLRRAKGWSLDALAARAHLSASSLSRIETGSRRISLDQLVPLARALEVSVDSLLAAEDDSDVVIRPARESSRGRTYWLLSRERDAQGVTIAKMRIEPTGEPTRQDEQRGVHPGREWFTVLSGTIRLTLGDRTMLISAGNAAEFATMVPHMIEAVGGPAEVLSIYDRDGRAAHLEP